MANKRDGAVEAAMSRLAAVLAEIAHNSPAIGKELESLRNTEPQSQKAEIKPQSPIKKDLISEPQIKA